MAEDLKGLIEKIQEEGVRVAGEKARAIELEAKKAASAIIEDARREADNMKRLAREEAVRAEQSTAATLKQAGRDLMLSLREEIKQMLDKLVTQHVQKALAPDEMGRVIASVVREHIRPEIDGIAISVSKEDLEKLERSLFSELGQKAKEGITLTSSDEIHGGFIISYDNCKSHFDFTDRALSDYIALHLKPRLAAILRG